MTFQVEMIRGEYSKPDFEEYSLTIWTWRTLLEFGRQNGWLETGTKPDPFSSTRNSEYLTHFKPTYEPEEWWLAKLFDSSDATALANALSLGLKRINDGVIAPPTLDVGYTTQEDREQRNKLLLVRIPEFIKFLEGGSFSFAFDD